MAVTPAIIRRTIAARLSAAGLREATGPMGAEAEPSTIVDRSFDVLLGDDTDQGQRVVSGVSMRLLQAIEVRVAHTVKPRRAPEARTQSLEDRTAVMRALLNRAGDALAECEASIAYRDGSTEERGGGAYLLTTLRYSIAYQLDLSPGVA